MALAMLALAVMACSSGPGGLPTHRDMNEYPGALFSGTLVREGPCVYADHPVQGREVPIWPSGTGLAGDTIVRDGHIVARIGDHVRFGGGGYSSYATARQFLDADAPEPCRDGTFWLVSTIEFAEA